MPRVEVTVRLHDQVVEQRCFRFNQQMRIGEGVGTQLILPCRAIDLWRDGEAIRVRGVRLLENDSLSVRMDALEIGFTHLPNVERRTWGPQRLGGDGRFAATLLVAALCVAWWDRVRLQFLTSDQSGAVIPEVFTAEVNETTEAGVAREESAIEGLGGQYRPGQMAEDRRTGIGWGQWAFPNEAVWAEDPQLSLVTRMYFNGYFGRVLEIETDAPEDWLLQGHAAAAEGDLDRAMDLYFQASGGQASLEQRATMHLRLTRLLSGESNFWGEGDGPLQDSPQDQLMEACRHILDNDFETALAQMDAVLSDWNRWSDMEQQGVRVAMASHPAMERLRAHPGFLSLLYRHMGSTAPARMR